MTRVVDQPRARRDVPHQARRELAARSPLRTALGRRPRARSRRGQKSVGEDRRAAAGARRRSLRAQAGVARQRRQGSHRHRRLDDAGVLARHDGARSRAAHAARTKVPDGLKRTLDVVAVSRLAAHGDDAQGREERRLRHRDRSPAKRQGEVAVEGDKLVWSFDVPRQSRRVADRRRGVARARSRAKRNRSERAEGAHVDPSKARRPTATTQATAGGSEAGLRAVDRGAGRGRYTGRRIDLDLKDADIHNVLRLLADVGHVNIVTADDVTGTVTIRMRNVPWDQALDVVLQAKGLGMVRQGNLIRVAPLAELQKERELEHRRGTSRSSSSRRSRRASSRSATRRPSELQARAKELLSPRGSIAVDERTNVLIARDIARQPEPHRGARSLARHADAAGARRGAHRRGDEPVPARRRHPVGRRRDVQRGHRQPDGHRVPVAASASPAATTTATRRPPVSRRSRATSRTRTSRSTCPAAVGTGHGGALGLTFGSIDNNLNLGRAPLGGRVERHGAHRLAARAS